MVMLANGIYTISNSILTNVYSGSTGALLYSEAYYQSLNVKDTILKCKDNSKIDPMKDMIDQYNESPFV